MHAVVKVHTGIWCFNCDEYIQFFYIYILSDYCTKPISFIVKVIKMEYPNNIFQSRHNIKIELSTQQTTLQFSDFEQHGFYILPRMNETYSNENCSECYTLLLFSKLCKSK